MCKLFTINDTFTGETLIFTNQYDAEVEAERRLLMHRNGYNIRRNRVPPCSNAVLKVSGGVYTLCTE